MKLCPSSFEKYITFLNDFLYFYFRKTNFTSSSVYYKLYHNIRSIISSLNTCLRDEKISIDIVSCFFRQEDFMFKFLRPTENFQLV